MYSSYYRDNGYCMQTESGNRSLHCKVFNPDGERNGTIFGLTGGPGCVHEHLAPISVFSNHGYRVVLFDPHNVGNSGEIEEPYTVKSFHSDIEVILKEFNNTENRILYGHSWGSMLALDYICNHIKKYETHQIDGIIACAPLFDTQKSIAVARETLVQEVSNSEMERIMELERENNYGEEYEEIVEKVYNNRVFTTPIPKFVQEESYERFNENMYESMWGPSEFTLSDDAVLENWSVLDDIERIDIPILLTSGINDEFGVSDMYYAANRIGTNASVSVINGASHTPLWENAEGHEEIVIDWIEENF